MPIMPSMMPSARYTNSRKGTSMIRSYRSPKTTVARSRTQGRGLFAVRPIRAGEIVTIKGGHLLTRAQLRRHRRVVGQADLQITEDLYLAPLDRREHDGVMMFLNHSCAPNVGIQGQIVFVAMRAIRTGEELTIDYAMFDSDSTPMRCNCAAPTCRGLITDRDWQRPDLQRRYRGYFSWYLQQKQQTGARASSGSAHHATTSSLPPKRAGKAL
jgi:hypothetical protein